MRSRGDFMLTFARRLQNKYAVLTKTDILRRQKEAVENVTSILGIADEDAARILRRYKW